MNNKLWEKVNGVGAIDPDHHGVDHEDSRWTRYRKAFNILFPSRSKAERMDDFLSAQQCSVLADWLPEFNMLATECNMKLELSKAVPQQMLQTLNAAPSGFDKWIVRKRRQLISMREYLADMHNEHEDKPETEWNLQRLFDCAIAYEKKILAKVALINKNLKRAKQKTIRFYGSFEETEIAAVQDQDMQEINFVKEESVTKVQLEAFKDETRNETQATIQSAVTSVRADIVGDVKSMFASLEKRLDADKEERQSSANQSQIQQQAQ